jgi:hypothetical protein
MAARDDFSLGENAPDSAFGHDGIPGRLFEACQ